MMNNLTFEEVKQQLTQRSKLGKLELRDTNVLLYLSKWTRVWYDSSFSSFDRIYVLKLKNGTALLPFYLSNETSVAYLSEFRMMNYEDVSFLEQAKNLRLNQHVCNEIDSFIQTQRLRSLFITFIQEYPHFKERMRVSGGGCQQIRKDETNEYINIRRNNHSITPNGFANKFRYDEFSIKRGMIACSL